MTGAFIELLTNVSGTQRRGNVMSTHVALASIPAAPCGGAPGSEEVDPPSQFPRLNTGPGWPNQCTPSLWAQ